MNQVRQTISRRALWKVRLNVAALALVSACGISEPEDQSVTVQVEGTVTSTSTGVAVSGAKVILADLQIYVDGGGSFRRLESTVTDASGKYSLSHVMEKCAEGGGFYLYVEADGFETYGLPSAGVDCTAGIQTRNIAL
ncbi:MAG TPA: carboxypeptidase-like regulatory domain-containing protein [Gemmatimonadaceae bacterium]|nr:carboxypeptidase-like regulatory domain-containing protein [Gemmatimonadaceae bacterium]